MIASKPEEIIFTRNTTESINLVSNSLGLKRGDVVVTSDREHNSNLVPWQIQSERTGVTHRIVRSKRDETFDMEGFKEAVRGARLVSVVHTSNIDGYTLPAREIIKYSHDAGALVMLDSAQSVPHIETDVKRLGADLMAFSGHKMLGPTGTGVLYARKGVIESLSPFIVGGHTVDTTTYESHVFLKPPARFEAGLQDYAGIIGLGAAARYLIDIGMKKVESHEKKLTSIIVDGLSDAGASLVGIGRDVARTGVVSFSINGVGYHDIATMLEEMSNIMIRSGQHCCHSWFRARRMDGSARASLYLYNTEEEAKEFIECVAKIIELR